METSFLINMSGAWLAASRRICADFHHALLSRTRRLPFLSAGIMITHQRLLYGYRGGGGSQVEVRPAHETSGCWLYCDSTQEWEVFLVVQVNWAPQVLREDNDGADESKRQRPVWV